MSAPLLETLSDVASEAHFRIQQDFATINPVIGVSQAMRRGGIPADAMTIDCLASKKRIIIILHDGEPENVLHQFSFIEQDPADDFIRTPASELSTDMLYGWMKEYFS